MAVGPEVAGLVRVGSGEHSSEREAIGEDEGVLWVEEFDISGSRVETKGCIDGAEGDIDPLPILVEIGARALYLIIDISEDGTGGGSVGGWGGPLESGGGEYIVEEAGDGVSSAKGVAEGVG